MPASRCSSAVAAGGAAQFLCSGSRDTPPAGARGVVGRGTPPDPFAVLASLGRPLSLLSAEAVAGQLRAALEQEGAALEVAIALLQAALAAEADTLSATRAPAPTVAELSAAGGALRGVISSNDEAGTDVIGAAAAPVTALRKAAAAIAPPPLQAHQVSTVLLAAAGREAVPCCSGSSKQLQAAQTVPAVLNANKGVPAALRRLPRAACSGCPCCESRPIVLQAVPAPSGARGNHSRTIGRLTPALGSLAVPHTSSNGKRGDGSGCMEPDLTLIPGSTRRCPKPAIPTSGLPPLLTAASACKRLGIGPLAG